MSEGPNEAVGITFLDYAALGFILTSIEEVFRLRWAGWPVWIPGFALGIIALSLRNRSTQLKRSLVDLFCGPKRLAAARLRIEALEVENVVLTDELRGDGHAAPLLFSTPEFITKTIALAINHYLSQAKITSPDVAREVLTKALGYAMERRAISGTVRAERKPIPDGWWPEPIRRQIRKK